MLREVMPEFLPYVLPLPCNIFFNVTSLWTWPACYWYGSETVAHPSARVCQGERWTLWTQTQPVTNL